MYNEKFIEITSGLKEGDRVLLAPPFDPQEKDLGGAILARGETVPASDTNQVARVLARYGGSWRARKRGEGPDRRCNHERARGKRLSPGSAHDLSRKQRRGNAAHARTVTAALSLSVVMRMLKRFDKNNDGQLDESERATMRVQLGNRVGRGTNAPLPEISRKPTDT
jgi:hypothetical protein